MVQTAQIKAREGQVAQAQGLMPNDLSKSDLSVGEILRRTREHYGLSIRDIEKNIRIRKSLVEAIEGGKIEELPGRSYAIGFVRSYADYLQLDGEKVVELYKARDLCNESAPVLNFPEASSEKRLPSMKVLAGSVAAILLLVVAGVVMTSQDRSIVTDVPEVSASLSDPALRSPATIEPAAGKPVVAAVAEEKGIILNVKEQGWVEIQTQEGEKLVSKVLEVGDRYFVPERSDLFISLGNAGGIDVTVNGQDIAKLGASGHVVSNLRLDQASLEAYSNKALAPTQDADAQ